MSMSKHGLRLLLGLSICACGSVTGKPLTAFPSRQELAEVAASDPAKQLPDVHEVALEEWQLELPELPSPNPGLKLLATLLPHATPTPALDCAAHELTRVLAETDGKPPSIDLRRFISARCGALTALPELQTWKFDRAAKLGDDAVVAELAKKLSGPLDASAKQAGFGLARKDNQVFVAVAYGTPQVQLPVFERVVGADGVLRIRGRVLFDVQGISAYVNDGELGARRCELDPKVVAPEFALSCQLAEGDDAAWFQLYATEPGRVLAHEVLSTLALRSSDAATHYALHAFGEPQPTKDVAGFRVAVLEQINTIRGRAGLAPLTLATKQCDTATAVTPAFFRNMLNQTEDGKRSSDLLTMGLMAGWDVQGGVIRNGAIIATLIVDSLDAERWVADALAQPSGRIVLLDPDARTLALGAALNANPNVLAAVALTYAFFEPESKPGERAMRVLERLARVRKARGLGRTVLVRDAPGVAEQLAVIQRGERTPSDAMHAAMERASSELRVPIGGFVWETQDLDMIEFPSELLQKGDLTLGAGVTYYRAPGGAWGQYVVLFVVIQRSGKLA